MFQPVKFSKTARKTIQMTSIGALALSLVACGSDGSDQAPLLQTGVFQDAAAVEGLSYETATMSGETNTDGEFAFNAGERIIFSLGGLDLPGVQAVRNVTSRTLLAGNEAAAADLSRLLQSMDEDGNLENGIRLPLNVQAIQSDTQIDFGGADFDMQAQALLTTVNGPDAMLIDSVTATESLNQALVDNELASQNCSAEHPYVGRSVELSNLAHGVSGTVTVINDCSLEVTGFNYDGGGPNVFFYAALDKAYASDSFIIGPQLNGRRWVNETILLPIPEGKSLDEFNSLSVWCIDFNANFGDAFFGDV